MSDVRASRRLGGGRRRCGPSIASASSATAFMGKAHSNAYRKLAYMTGRPL
jgi:hypothetical protein